MIFSFIQLPFTLYRNGQRPNGGAQKSRTRGLDGSYFN